MPYRPSLSVESALSGIKINTCACIDQAVSDAFNAAEQDTFGRAGEVDRLVYFFTDGVPALAAGLNKLLSPLSLELTINTVFCHQSPIVDPIPPFVSGRGSELADLIILVHYGDRTMQFWRGLGNAVLLQAKSDFFPGCSPEQEYLFESAAAFSYRASSMQSRGRRYLKGANDCLWYWDFETQRNRGQSKWLTKTLVKRQWPRTMAFSELLFGLIVGDTGRGVRRKADHLSGWSRVIHDLLEITANRAYRRKIVNANKLAHGRRGRVCLAFLTAQEGVGAASPLIVYNGGPSGWQLFGDEFSALISSLDENDIVSDTGEIPPTVAQRKYGDGGEAREGGVPSFLLVSLDQKSES